MSLSPAKGVVHDYSIAHARFSYMARRIISESQEFLFSVAVSRLRLFARNDSLPEVPRNGLHWTQALSRRKLVAESSSPMFKARLMLLSGWKAGMPYLACQNEDVACKEGKKPDMS